MCGPLLGVSLFRETDYQNERTHRQVSCHTPKPYSSQLQLQGRSQPRSWEESSPQSEGTPDKYLGYCHVHEQQEDLPDQHQRRMLCPLR